MQDLLRYDHLVEQALRGVVRQALTRVAVEGLPGQHHFYVTFRTTHPDVVMPDTLRESYPEEMTIVLQYQFWGLEVGEESFSVSLSFNDKPEMLTIPFEAITGFVDPSVKFGLQFRLTGDGEGESDDETAASGAEAAAGGAAGDALAGETDDSGEAAAVEEEGDNIVALDRFRKK